MFHKKSQINGRPGKTNIPHRKKRQLVVPENDVLIRTATTEIVNNPSTFDPAICAEDEMHLFAKRYYNGDSDRAYIEYLRNGKQVMDLLEQVAAWKFGGVSNIPKFLEFACGHGRVTRFLVQSLPAEHIWGADISPNAVGFQKERFGVNGVLSTTAPEDYDNSQLYDFIFVASLFSHLPDRTFRGWLKKLFQLLEPDGILMFSVHGESLVPPDRQIPDRTFRGWLKKLFQQLAPNGILMFRVHDENIVPPARQMPEEGFLFINNSESRTLSKDEYGSTFVTEKYLKELIREELGEKIRYYRSPRSLYQCQCTYIVSNNPTIDFSGLDLCAGPRGNIDALTIDDNFYLHASGWTADTCENVLMPKVQIQINNAVISTFLPDIDRPDVVQFYNNDQILKSGWSRTEKLHECKPSDILIIRALNHLGIERVLNISTLGPLLN